MLFARSLAGALSGNMAVVSSMLCEITDETNQGKAFPLIAATWYIGIIIGPMIGGNLSNPMKKWPEVFRDYPLFQAYPYLLPCLVSSSISVFAIAMCGFFIRETLPSKVAAQNAAAEQKKFGLSKVSSYGTIHTSTSTRAPSPNPPSRPLVTDASEASNTTFAIPGEQGGISNSEHVAVAAETASVFHLLSSPHVRAVLATSFMFSLLGIAFEVVFVLYSHTGVDLGGIGRSPAQIGYALAGSGAVGIVILLGLFPFIQQRFNNRRLYTFFSTFWALAFSLMPIGNFAARLPMGGNQNKKDAVEWAAIILILIPIKIAMNVYPLNLVILKASVAPDQLGKMFGLQQTCSSVARGIAPIFVSSLFAFSLDHQILGGHFVWLVLFLLSLVAVSLTMRVKDVPAPRSV